MYAALFIINDRPVIKTLLTSTNLEDATIEASNLEEDIVFSEDPDVSLLAVDTLPEIQKLSKHTHV